MENKLIQSYGRRQGRCLKGTQKSLLERYLDALSFSPEEAKKPEALFPNAPKECWLEIGFGSGEHLAHQAALYPNVGLIGSEVYINGVVGLLAKVDAQELDNIRVFKEDARLLLQALPEASISKLFILFPDPWPKTRQHKKRLIQPAFMDLVARVIPHGGELLIATDHAEYLEHIVKVMMPRKDFTWTARSKKDWLTEPQDWTPTRYQQKAEKEGRHATFLHFRRGS